MIDNPLRVEACGRLAEAARRIERRRSGLMVAGALLLDLPSRAGLRVFRVHLLAFGAPAEILLIQPAGAVLEVAGSGDLNCWQGRDGSDRRRLRIRVESVRVVGAEPAP